MFQLGFPSLAVKESWLLKLPPFIAESRDHMDHSFGSESFSLELNHRRTLLPDFIVKDIESHNYTLTSAQLFTVYTPLLHPLAHLSFTVSLRHRHDFPLF